MDILRKSCLVGLLALGLGTSVYAETGETHFYFGIGSGGEIYAPTRHVTRMPLAPGNAGIYSKFRDGTVGYTGGVFGGVNHELSPIIGLGVELGAYGSTSSYHATVEHLFGSDLTAGVNLRHQADLSVALMPSYALNQDTLAFLKVGYDLGRFSLKPTEDTGGDLIADSYRSTWRSGYFVGLGLQTKVTDITSARLEYAYSQHRRISGHSQLPVAELNGDKITSSVRPYLHRVLLGVSFSNPLIYF